MWEVAVRLAVACGVCGGVFLCCSFSRGVSWMGSWTWLGRFLGVFLPTFALISYFCMEAHKAAGNTLSKVVFLINEYMVHILLMLEVVFIQDSKLEDLIFGASSGSEPSLFFSNYLFSLGLKPIQNDFQHDFVRMTQDILALLRLLF